MIESKMDMTFPSSLHRQTSGSHAGIPLQLPLGILFTVGGALLLLKKAGRDYLPFIPEEVIIYIVAIGSLIGGLYLIWKRLWRPRIYL